MDTFHRFLWGSDWESKRQRRHFEGLSVTGLPGALPVIFGTLWKCMLPALETTGKWECKTVGLVLKVPGRKYCWPVETQRVF